MTICETTAAGFPVEIPLVIGRYYYVKTLSTGSTSVCVEVANRATHESLACKVVSRIALTHTGDFCSFEQELRVHQFLNDPNIVTVHEVIYQPDLVFVFLDLCSGGDLLSYLLDHPSLSPSRVRPWLIQILKALDYLHSRGIAHRDVKPDNVLITATNDVKLADFGCCEVTTLNAEPKASGTIYYAAPEIFLRTSRVGIKADIWSFGIMLFVLFSGQWPWLDGDNEYIAEQITHRKISQAYRVPRDVIPLFEKCTALNPDDRPTAAELLKDPWLAGEPIKRGRSVLAIRRQKQKKPWQEGAAKCIEINTGGSLRERRWGETYAGMLKVSVTPRSQRGVDRK
jgi:serine/threonine protein kinase